MIIQSVISEGVSIQSIISEGMIIHSIISEGVIIQFIISEGVVRFIEESVVEGMRVTPTIKLWGLSCCIVFLRICGV